MSKPCVLIVEDNAVFRNTLRSILNAKTPQVNVVEAENARQALDKIRTTHPDLIFMDINLSNGNGLRLTEEIKSLFPEMLVFIITNYDSPEYREKAMENGADLFLSKASLTEDIMVKTIEKFIPHQLSAC